MKYFVVILITIFCIQVGWTQKIEEITHREINVHFNDSSVMATILLGNKKVRLNNSKDYYWYYNNSINSNQGDYKGRLLDGAYQVTSKHGQLISKGSFAKGNKNGEWKNWNIQGNLEGINNWSKGYLQGRTLKYSNGKTIEKGAYKKNKLQGIYRVYDNEKLIEKRNYKNGVLHGKQIVYKADTIFSEEKYKKGKLIIPKEKIKKVTEKEDSSVEDSKNKKDQKTKKDNSVKKNKKQKKDLNSSDDTESKKVKIKSKKRREKEQGNKVKTTKDD